MNLLNFKHFTLLLILVINFPAYTNEFQKNITIYSTAAPGAIAPELYRSNTEFEYNYPIPGYAVIREKKEFELKEGENKINISDVSAYVDPTTVIFKAVKDSKSIQVLDQNYNFDLVSNKKLLEKYLGLEISVDQNIGNQIETINGKLLGTSGGLILQNESGKLTSITNYSNIRYSDLSEGLTTKPTLTWNINAAKAGNHEIVISYQTSGITWWADYNAIYAEGKDISNGFLDLNAWVSIINKSGASYENAKLKLIAGNVNKVKASAMARGAPMLMAVNDAEKSASNDFNEKSFFEFHLYTLNNATTISNNSTKQIALFKEITKIPVKKQFVYRGNEISYYGYLNTDSEYGKQANTKIDVYLKFKNSKESGLGIALPAGRIRVGKIDNADNSWEFIGEDIIDHTAKDEDIMIKMGSAFDITGSRKQINYNINEARRLIKETFEITIKNHKDTDVEVIVKENLYRWTNWQILESSSQHQKVDSQTIQFPITVKKDSETKLQYTVQYDW